MVSKSGKAAFLKERYTAGEKKSLHAMQEFGPGRAGFIFCPYGEAVYYKKSWHHSYAFESYALAPRKSYALQARKNPAIKFKLCPVHEMLKNKQYEGEVIIKNLPVEFRRELLNLIENFGERTMRRNVLSRILTIHEAHRTIRLTTSENQLAQKLAQKISEVFKKKVDFKILRAREGDVTRVEMDFISR